jgi:hypothetical protein
MSNILTLVIDTATKEKIDLYAKSHAISRSSALRVIVNSYFENKPEVKP